MTTARDASRGGDGGAAVGGAPTFTVLTPTYNRVATLPAVYASLCAQTCTDFEWLVVDDGSGDDTRALVEGWAQAAPFAIRYVWQPNGGKPSAVNRGVQHARGEFTVVLDSDDTCRADALETFARIWESIPHDRRAAFSGVAVHTATPDGVLVGTPFPADVVDAHAHEMAYRHRVTGEKWGMLRTAVLRDMPYPLADGERWAPEGLVWQRIGRRYLTRHVNVALRTYVPSPDGITARVRDLMRRNPNGTAQYYRELADLDVGVVWRFGALVRYAKYARLAGHTARQVIGNAPRPALGVAATVAAAVLEVPARVRGRLAARQVDP